MTILAKGAPVRTIHASHHQPRLPAASTLLRRLHRGSLSLRASAQPGLTQSQPPSNDSRITSPTSIPTPVPVASTPNPAAATTPTPTATPTASAPNENFSGDMLGPSVVNTPLVRAAAVLAAVAAVAGSTLLLPDTVGAFLHMTSYAVLLGTQLWNTFFVGITMFKNLPRQTFGRVQAKLFPQYFAITTGANLLALATLTMAGALMTAPGSRAIIALAVSFVGLMANWLWVEPICTGLMFERYDIENQEVKTDADKDRIAALYKQFGKWHGISSLINLVSFCVVVAHGWFLASLLVFGS